MFKNSISRLVPNQFNSHEQQDYIKQGPKKIKNKVNLPTTKPFKDVTNLQPAQKNIKPTAIQLNNIQSDQQCNFVGKSSEGKIMQIEPKIFKDHMGSRKLEETELTKQKQKALSIQKISDKFIYKQDQQKIEQKKIQNFLENPILNQPIKKPAEKKNLFNIEQSDTSTDKQQEENQKQLSEKKIINLQHFDNAQKQKQQNQAQNIFSQQIQQKKQQKKFNSLNIAFKFDVELSSDSEYQNAPVQQKKQQSHVSKLILNKFDSDQQEDAKTHIQQQSKVHQIQQVHQDELQIIRNMNIKKLKVHFQFVKTDPNFLAFCPIPPQSKTSLIVKRDTQNSQYLIFDSELVCPVLKIEKSIGGTYKFLMVKDSLSNKQVKSEQKQVAKMKANFLGTEFHCYSYKQKAGKKQKYQCVSIKYDVNILGLNGPRKLKFYAAENAIPGQQNLLKIYEKNPLSNATGVKSYQSKTPKWMPQLNAYVLNLRGTASYSSIKNCIIVDSEDENKQHLIFGKKSKDIFNLQIKHPFTILQGVAFAVSSFEKKLGCE